jgi:hypothetical protein
MTHRWTWNNPEGRKGHRCRILLCHRRKALIVFEDGFRMVAPVQGLRRLP